MKNSKDYKRAERLIKNLGTEATLIAYSMHVLQLRLIFKRLYRTTKKDNKKISVSNLID